MAHPSSPTIETTKDFILIKIPRTMFSGKVTHGKFSRLEDGLAKSLQEANQGKLYGPFSNAKDFLRVLKEVRVHED